MASQLIWAKIKQDVVVNGREFSAGSVTELTLDEFKQLARRGACIPTGERGRAMTSAAFTTDLQTARRGSK